MIRLLRDYLWWAWCRMSFAAVIWMPYRLMDGRLYFFLLGYAGMYAYSEDWKSFRLCVQWNIDGRPSDHEHIEYMGELYDRRRAT